VQDGFKSMIKQFYGKYGFMFLFVDSLCIRHLSF